MSETPLSLTYSAFLLEAMKTNDAIAHIDCDLAASLFKGAVKELQKNFPDRFINMGIQEANAVGFACGLSQVGFTPFVHSFGPFMSRRVADQIFISGAYSKANVKIIGSDPGVTAQYNGGTHMPFEDLAIMRSIPEITIVEPADEVALKALLPQIANTYGMFYIRLPRASRPAIYEEGTSFNLGKANLICDGKDVTLIASGVMVEESLAAVKLLKAEGISARLIDMFCIRPLDKDIVIDSAQKTGAIVTAENASVNGGLGDAVSQVILENCLVPQERIAVHEKFGQVGDMAFLKGQYNMTAADIAQSAKKAIARKIK